MSVSSKRINTLADLINARTYLEIGVSNGFTFRNVKIEYRDAVDVRFGFPTAELENDKTRFFEQSSDDFFTSENPKIYDIIFIDGLHTYEQTLRDFLSSLRFSHQKTIWIIDDTIPSDIFSSIRNPNLARRYRSEHGFSGANWHGDVYKVIAFIHDFMPTIKYHTTAGSDNPQTIAMWGSRSFAPIFNSTEAISRLDFFDLGRFQDSDGFKMLEFEEILNWANSNLSAIG